MSDYVYKLKYYGKVIIAARILEEMLEIQGYNIDVQSDKSQGLYKLYSSQPEDLFAYANSNNFIYIFKHKTIRKKILVFIANKMSPNDITLDAVRGIDVLINKNNNDFPIMDVLFTNDKKPTNDAMSKLNTLPIDGVNSIQSRFVDINNLLYNPSTHSEVPKHEKVPDDNKEELLNSLMVKPYQLPIISINDPLVIFYGWKRNDIIKITRYETPGRDYIPNYYYRRVV